jgi:hypothetical protein
VIVIDRSSSDWIDHSDVEDACYGEERLGVAGGEWVNTHHPGIFDDLSKARISAVVSYTRRWRDEYGDDSIIMAILHNPNASKPLPPEALTFAGVIQTRRESSSRGFQLVTTPEVENANSDPCSRRSKIGRATTP